MPARNSSGSRGKKTDLLSLLKEDHKKVKSMLEDLTSGEDDDASEIGQLWEQIQHELKVHTELEEKFVYPALRETKEEEDEEMYFESFEEHHLVDLVMEDIRKAQPGDPSFMARAKVLAEMVKHHIKEEEKEMFPRLKKILDEQALDEIGAKIMQMKEQMEPAMATRRK